VRAPLPHQMDVCVCVCVCVCMCVREGMEEWPKQAGQDTGWIVANDQTLCVALCVEGRRAVGGFACLSVRAYVHTTVQTASLGRCYS